jgi:ribosomal protein L37AE/L43A
MLKLQATRAGDSMTGARSVSDLVDRADGIEPCPACGELLAVEGRDPGMYQCKTCDEYLRVME